MNDLIWCIDYLEKYNGLNLNLTYDFQTFRALMNITMPEGLSEEYYERQDNILKKEISDDKILDSETLEYRNNISVHQGDIVLLRCDAIVNACNEKLLGCFHPLHNCVDNIIHSYAGLQVRRDLMAVMTSQGHDEENGRCKVTSGYNLKAGHIFHTVGPKIGMTISTVDRIDLSNCYLSCMKAASDLGLKSIAFPCISTGIYGFDQKEASLIAYGTVSEFLRTAKSDIKVIFVTFKEKDYMLYRKIWDKPTMCHGMLKEKMGGEK